MIFFVFLLAIGSAGVASAQDSASALRRDLAEQSADGLTESEAVALARRGMDLATQAGSANERFNAFASLSAICAVAPTPAAREIRRSALGLLAGQFHDARRWSVLLVEGFLPAFDRLPVQSWPDELRHYESILDEIGAGPVDERAAERVRAELAWGRAYVRLHLDRETDWLDETQRAGTLAQLESIDARFGTLSVPGAHGSETDTVGERARAAMEEMRALAFGAPAPATSGVALDGSTIDLADHRGRVVVLDFWTSFCLPCLAMVPHTRQMLEQLEGEPVSFFGVCGDESQQKGLATVRRTGMTWPSFWDGPSGSGGPIATDWHVASWPTVYVLDGNGLIRFKFHSREEAEAGLERAIRTLLAERR